MERKVNRFNNKKKEEETKPFNKNFYGKKTEAGVGVNKKKAPTKWQPNDDLKEQEQNTQLLLNTAESKSRNKNVNEYGGSKSSSEKRGTGYQKDKRYGDKEGSKREDFSQRNDFAQTVKSRTDKFHKKDTPKTYRDEEQDDRYQETAALKKKSLFDQPEKRERKTQRAYEPRKKSAPKGPSMPRVVKDPNDETIRLNKFISNAGICSRREADELIKAGAVTVNGKVVTEMGFKIKRTDLVNYGGQGLKPERQVYILLNKPKDYITTSDDPQERRTVMELIKGACKERVYPVGRLDRNTTGLLLLTNDGELTDKITHPSFKQKKIYHVELDKPVKKEHLKSIQEGIELEDGFIKADEANYVENSDGKNEIGITLHSGRNRIVRRIFEHFDYKVKKLDRVYFAGLTKKDLARGRWRFLTPMEINMLKMIQ